MDSDLSTEKFWKTQQQDGKVRAVCVTVLKPWEGPGLKPFWHFMIAEAQQGVRGEKLTMWDIPVSAIMSPHSCSPYSPGKSGAKHTAFDHCVLSALKSTFTAKKLAGHFQNVHIIFIVSKLFVGWWDATRIDKTPLQYHCKEESLWF